MPLQSSLSSHSEADWHGLAAVLPLCAITQKSPWGQRPLSGVCVHALVVSSHWSTVQAIPSDAQAIGVPALQPEGPTPLGSQASCPSQERPSEQAASIGAWTHAFCASTQPSAVHESPSSQTGGRPPLHPT